MALALVLLFDAVASAAVRELWDEMAARGISTSMTDLGYPPHLTLIVVEDETLAPVLDKGVAELAKGARLAVTLGPVGRFDETDVVWLGCDGPGLLDLQAEAAALVGDEAVSVHYRPALGCRMSRCKRRGMRTRRSDLLRSAGASWWRRKRLRWSWFGFRRS